MRLPRRWKRSSLIFLLLLLAATGWLSGWTAPQRSWEEATGWNRIPEEQRAPIAAILWPGRDAPRLHWLGHAGFLLEWAGTRLLLDPNASRWCTIAKRELEPSRPPEELGPIDGALISHAHFDHLDLPTLRRLPRLDLVVLPEGSGKYAAELEPRGTRIVELSTGSAVTLGSLEVFAVPARHNGNRWHPLNSHNGANGYVIRRGEDSLYFAGDTGYGGHFAELRNRFRPRAAILPIGAYAPRFPMAFYHLSPEEAVQAARVLEVEVTIPGHFGTYPLSLDRPSWALPRFAEAAQRQGLHWVLPAFLPADESTPDSQRAQAAQG